MAANKKVLFVSEKKSALEVVKSRLDELKIGRWVAYFDTSSDQKKLFYKQLKSTWEYLQNNALTEESVAIAHEAESELLHYYTTKLTSIRPNLGTSLQALIDVLITENQPINELTPIGKVPNFSDWKNHYGFLQTFHQKLSADFDYSHFSEAIFCTLNPAVFTEQEVLLKLEKRLNDLQGVLSETTLVLRAFELKQMSYKAFVQLAISASVLNMVDKAQLNLLNEDAKEYKSFNTWAKKYERIKNKLDQAKKANEKWQNKPTLNEIIELRDLIQRQEQSKKTFFSAFRRTPEKLKRAFEGREPTLSNTAKLTLLDSLETEWQLKAQLDEIELKLKHNLGIHKPANEINHIFQLRKKLNAVSTQQYLRILEHPNSQKLIRTLAAMHPNLVRFNAQVRFVFDHVEVDNLGDFEVRLHQLIAQLPLIAKWLPELTAFFKLPPDIREFLKRNSAKLPLLNAQVAYANLLNETRFDPYFKTLNGWMLTEELQDNENKKSAVYKRVKNTISQARSNQFFVNEKKSKTPAFKLTDTEKTEKKKYKQERRLLIHEMNKRQRHLSIKACFAEAEKTLLDLCSVWMLNPLTVSENLPCIADLFDVVIFDESSQIPLEDAVPSIYRAKRVVIVGDDQQMPPSQFFSSHSADTKTILHQAKMVYPTEMLKWHYRSQHPALISFSNQHFYQNELVYTPPKNTENPIVFKHVKGVFDAGKNKQEADEIVTYCENLTPQMLKQTAVIAFSKEQEKEIKQRLKRRLGKTAEMVLIRNLENAQGIEANLVLISVGYGPNNEGVFRLNLGPVNQTNGANRLNVLFTRAKEKMVVFSSVTAADFPLSDNYGISILKDFLHYAQGDYAVATTTHFQSKSEKYIGDLLDQNGVKYEYYTTEDYYTVNCFLCKNRKSILLVNPCLDENEVTDLSSAYHQLKQQFKQVKIVLTVDLWQHKSRVENEIIAFFQD